MSRRRSLLSVFTGQTAPLRGAATPQVPNSAGGFAWAVDDRARMERFLILGSESGSYYATPRALTLDNAAATKRVIAADGPRAVERVARLSESGRAPRNDAAILALALALKTGDAATRAAAAQAVPRVCRTGTHLFALAAAVESQGGWGRGTRRAFAGWYAGQAPDALALQAVKYQQRDGWSHRDLLRLCHAAPADAAHGELYRWMCRGFGDALPDAPPSDALRLPWAMARAHALADDPAAVARLVAAHGLPRECVPGQALRHPAVWEALVLGPKPLPMTATLRNLAAMTAAGLFTSSRSALDAVCGALTDRRALRRGRIHPLAVLVALNTYKAGRGLRGKLSWTPHAVVLDALDQAFSASFDAVEPTGARWMLAVDVSGSMGWGEIAGMTGITPRVGAGAMALAALRSERHAHVVAFSHALTPVDISARMRLDDVLARFDAIPMGGTDCAAPILYALKRRIPVDVFAIYTDSETWAGQLHPAEALRRYRAAMGIPAKLVVVGMVSNGFTIADPDDAGMLDVVGFDTTAPALMADFARGR